MQVSFWRSIVVPLHVLRQLKIANEPGPCRRIVGHATFDTPIRNSIDSDSRMTLQLSLLTGLADVHQDGHFSEAALQAGAVL